MNKKIKLLLSFFLVCFFMIAPTIQVNHEGVHYSNVALAKDDKELEIQTQPATNDTKELYNRYKDNSFSLMNQEFSSLNKINQFMQNSFLTLKNFLFGAVVFLGKFNVMLVNSLFDLDIANSIKEPIQQLSLKLSNNIISVASTIGVLAIGIFMITKLIATGQPRQAMRVFMISLLSFVVLTTFNNPTTNKYFFDGVISVDNSLENAFADMNPQFTDEELEGDGVGDKIAAEVFRTNIYEPYLYFNYGTTDADAIRKKTVEYKGEEYDRIGALLDNDGSSEKQIDFIESITDYEADELDNNVPSYKNASAQSFNALAYIITNIIQTIIFLILGILRLALQFLLIVIPLFLPIIMIAGMILSGTSLLGNFFKGFMTVSFMKASLSFLTVVFVNYVALAYTMNVDTSNILELILTRIAWIIAPVFVYKFRFLIASIFSKTVRMNAGGMMNSFMHPNLARDMARQVKQSKADQKEKAREALKQKRQQQKDGNGGSKDKKNDLNQVKPKDSSFSKERNRNKDNPNDSNVSKENKDGKKQPINSTNNGQSLQGKLNREERASATNTKRNGANNNPTNDNKQNLKQPTQNSGKNGKQAGNIRQERVNQAQKNDANNRQKDAKGAVNPVKNNQKPNRQTTGRAENVIPMSSKQMKNEGNRGGQNPATKQRINRQSLPKTMKQPVKVNKTTGSQRTLQINKKGKTPRQTVHKKAPKFSMPKK